MSGCRGATCAAASLPLGTALIAASVVMFSIRGRSQPLDAERPKRWVLPEPLERRTDR